MFEREKNPEMLKLSIQKEGRLSEDTLSLLRACGLEFEMYFKRRLFSNCRNFPLALLNARDDDIVQYVSSGTVDLGIVGQNLIYEKQNDVIELLPLDFGYCSLVVAVPDDSGIEDIRELEGKKVATSYPYSTRKYFEERGIQVKIITISGSVEVTPLLGVASAIVDLSSTGSSLAVHDLRKITTILSSQAVLITNTEAFEDRARKKSIDRLLMRIKGVLTAKRYKYVMMNVPQEALSKIRALVPGLKSPTVMSLDNPDWVAVHTAIPEEDFWEITEQLHMLGARDILVSPIEKLVM